MEWKQEILCTSDYTFWNARSDAPELSEEAACCSPAVLLMAGVHHCLGSGFAFPQSCCLRPSSLSSGCTGRLRRSLLAGRTQPARTAQPGASKPCTLPREASGLQGRWAGGSNSSPLPTTPFPGSISPSSSISARAPQPGWACCPSIRRINFLSTPRAETINQYTNRHPKTCLMGFLFLPPLATGLCTGVVSKSPVSEGPCLSPHVTWAWQNWLLVPFMKSGETKKSLKMRMSADYINSLCRVRTSLLWQVKVFCSVIQECGKVDVEVLRAV